MKGSTILASLAATAFVLASGAVYAQGQQGGGQQAGQQGGQQGSAQQQMQQQQQRQAERAMDQNQTMDQQRLQTRERDRTQDGGQAQKQTQATKGSGEGIYGGNLMTVQERNQYRAELGALTTDEERLEYKARNRERMDLRAQERGIDPQVTYD